MQKAKAEIVRKMQQRKLRPIVKQITAAEYLDGMVNSFMEFISYCNPVNKNSSKYEDNFIVDCANGVCSDILRWISKKTD